MLQNQPELVQQLRQRLAQSGLTPDQVRARLRAAGYPGIMLDDYLQGADTTAGRPVRPAHPRCRPGLGVLSAARPDSLARMDSLAGAHDSLRSRARFSIRLIGPIRSAPTRSPIRSRRPARRAQAFRPRDVPANDAPGTSRASRARWMRTIGWARATCWCSSSPATWSVRTTLEVTREGFIVIPQVGQVYAANLTLGQLEDQLYARLGKVYSGVRRSPNATDQVPAFDLPGSATFRSTSPATWCVPAPTRSPAAGTRAHRPLCRRWTHQQRQLSSGRRPPRPEAGRQSRSL